MYHIYIFVSDKNNWPNYDDVCKISKMKNSTKALGSLNAITTFVVSLHQGYNDSKSIIILVTYYLFQKRRGQFGKIGNIFLSDWKEYIWNLNEFRHDSFLPLFQARTDGQRHFQTKVPLKQSHIRVLCLHSEQTRPKIKRL